MSAVAVIGMVAGLLATLEPGGYALGMVVAGPRAVPLLGNLDTRTESWSYVELVGEPNSDTGFLATETPCSIESDGGLLVTRAGPRTSTRSDEADPRRDHGRGRRAPPGP